jgi:hypothetical protein
MKDQMTLEDLQLQANAFNNAYPVGTPVTRYALIDPLRMPEETYIQSEAWVMGGHSVMVKVGSVRGGVVIESILPIAT